MKRRVTNAEAEVAIEKSQRLLDEIMNDINLGRKTEIIILRVSPEEKELIKAKAMKSGFGVSAFIRDVILERIAEIRMV